MNKEGDFNMSKLNLKVYLCLLIIFVPIIVITAYILPGNYKVFTMVWILVFWFLHYVIRKRISK
jgi:hypothetical protein